MKTRWKFDPHAVAHIAATLLTGQTIEPHRVAPAIGGALALLDEAHAQLEAREAAAHAEAAAEVAAAEAEAAKAHPEA